MITFFKKCSFKHIHPTVSYHKDHNEKITKLDKSYKSLLKKIMSEYHRKKHVCYVENLVSVELAKHGYRKFLRDCIEDCHVETF